MAICFSPIKKSVRSFLSTWRLWTAYITTRKLTDTVSVSLSFVILIGNCPDFHVQRKAKTLLIYLFITILFLCFYSVLTVLFIDTNTLTHSHINAFFYVISRCKDTKFSQYYSISFITASSVGSR